MDHISPEKRSYVMSRIRSKDTAPEIAVRRLVFAMGYRYRLYDKSLPGKPDLVFRRKRKVLYVHGCFWHQHEKCPTGKPPVSNLDYWLPKFKRTVERDRQNINALRKQGWRALVVWECQLGHQIKVMARIRHFLNSNNKMGGYRKQVFHGIIPSKCSTR